MVVDDVCRVAVVVVRQLLWSLWSDPDSSFSVVVNGCEVDGNNSFDASVFVLRLDAGSANQPVFFL